MNSAEVHTAEISAIKAFLLDQKGSILNQSLEFKLDQLNQTQMSDEAEIASQDISNNISIHLFERNRHSLMMIEKALAKIADGTYGLCETCGDNIGIRRLQASPFTSLCIACMEEREDTLKDFQ